MYKVRVIPRLDIKGPNLVKGIHLEGLRVLGNPAEFAKLYYQQGADEIFYMDCVASLFERNSLSNLVEETAKSIFIPITVGGGLRTVEDIRSALKAGADKVCINTAAIRDPSFINRASRVFGSSTIVVAIEAIKQADGKYLAFVDNGREHTGLEVGEWAKEAEKMGAGELVISSVDRDGTGEGFDFSLISSIAKIVNIPVIAHGGASTISNSVDMIKETGVHGICVASAFHYEALEGKRVSRTVRDSKEGNTRFLSSDQKFRKIGTFGLPSLKSELLARGVCCRPVSGETTP